MVQPERTRKQSDGLAFDRRNYVTFALALATIIAGWLALGRGSITLAPPLLVAGYCVLVPAAILLGIRDRK